MELNLCMASDDKYSANLGICLVSILENNSSHINMHILDNNISEINRNKIKQLENQYSNLKISFHDVKEYFKKHDYGGVVKNELKSNEFYNLLGISAYARLFLGDILPKNINKILYLDADTIVLDDLKELYEIDVNEYYCAGVINMNGNSTKSFYKGHQFDTPFINSGVLLINVDKWRKDDFINSSIKLINEYPDKNYLHDQNIINILSKGKIRLISPKFNVMSEYFYVEYKKYLKLNSYFGNVDYFYSVEQMNHSLNNPVIVHFLSQIWDRPWIKQNGLFKHKVKNPYNKCYDYYKKKSPWKNEPLIESDLSFKQKLYYEIIRIIMILSPAYVLVLLQKLKK